MKTKQNKKKMKTNEKTIKKQQPIMSYGGASLTIRLLRLIFDGKQKPGSNRRIRIHNFASEYLKRPL